MVFTDESNFEDFEKYLAKADTEYHTDFAEIEDHITRNRIKITKFNYGTIFYYINKEDLTFDDVKYMIDNFNKEIADYMCRIKSGINPDYKSLGVSETNKFFMLEVDWEEEPSYY